MVEHIVLLRLKPGATPAQTAALLQALQGLRDRIPGILDITGGPNDSPEGKHEGFNWGFIIRFENKASRDGYLPHPDHKSVGASFLRPIVDGVLVFDYEHP
jgi:hypothetical protein